MPFKKNAAERKLPFTAAVDEGPYYTHGSPERTNIAEPGTPGKKLVLEGFVFDTARRPVPRAWLDFWQAGSDGLYDNKGFNLRGHQYADASGHYHLETIKPKGYQVRAPHIHAKVRAAENAPVLTTQLFFPGEAKNTIDPIFEKLTVMNVVDAGDTEKATFNFVVRE